MQTVTSKDGTTIAYDKTGPTDGGSPVVILVGGATATRGGMAAIAAELSADCVVYNYDRRGRGDSTGAKPQSDADAVVREIEDIDALIDAAGGSACLFGISSGGALALEAALKLGSKVKKLAVYEAPYDDSETGQKAWHEYRTELKQSLDAGNHGDAAAAFMKLVGMPAEQIEGMRQAPFWASMEAVAPTLAYDAADLGDDRLVPVERIAKITVPTLVMDGGGSQEHMPFMRVTAEALVKAIPNARHQVLEGQTHDVDAKVLAPALAQFFKD